jgi:hypothetical protein
MTPELCPEVVLFCDAAEIHRTTRDAHGLVEFVQRRIVKPCFCNANGVPSVTEIGNNDIKRLN